MARRSKYNVRLDDLGKLARTVDGVEFASQAEARRYEVLRNREDAGEIEELELQPHYELQEAFTDNAGHHRAAITYTADFRYEQDGEVVVEEVKGHASRDFSVRMRLFLYQYPEVVYKLIPAGDVVWAE
jgi:hypothetical protein